MRVQNRLGQSVVVAIRTFQRPTEVLADARRKVVEENRIRIRVEELEKEGRVPLSKLPLPRRIEAGSRQLKGPHSIHERTSGENRERRKIRTPEAVPFTAQTV